MLNASGCIDETCYKAIECVSKEERKKLISELKELARKHWYEISCYIYLREIR